MAYVSTYEDNISYQVSTRADLPVETLTVAQIGYQSGSGLVSSYPINVSYEKMFEWYWRVKEWTIDVIASWSLDQGGVEWVGAANFSKTFLWHEAPGIPVDPPWTERDIVCGGPSGGNFYGVIPGTYAGGNGVQYDPSGVATDYNLHTAIRILPFTVLSNGISDKPFWKHNIAGDTRWPAFTIAMSLYGDDGSGAQGGIALTNVSAYVGGGSQTMLIDGFNAPLLGWSGVPGVGAGEDYSYPINYPLPGGWTQSISSSVSLYPSKWWEYDPDDGDGPVWDSSTGAQLRDPFSIQR